MDDDARPEVLPDGRCPVADPDADLARRAAAGDARAFDTLVERCSPRMRRQALGLLDGDVEAAEDVVQESLTRAWHGLPGFEYRSSLGSWLFRITANEVSSYQRRQHRTDDDEHALAAAEATGAEGPEQRHAAAELAGAVDRVLEGLPARQREVWLLRQQGLSYLDIAGVVGTDVTVVRGLLHRSRREVAARMAGWR